MHSRTLRSILPGKMASKNCNIWDLVSSNGYLDVLKCTTLYVFMPNSHYPLEYSPLTEIKNFVSVDFRSSFAAWLTDLLRGNERFKWFDHLSVIVSGYCHCVAVFPRTCLLNDINRAVDVCQTNQVEIWAIRKTNWTLAFWKVSTPTLLLQLQPWVSRPWTISISLTAQTLRRPWI